MQPRSDTDFRRYHEQAKAAMAPIDAAPDFIRHLVHEYGPAAVQHAIDMIGPCPRRLPGYLATLRADRQRERIGH